jgi:flagellar basal body-associated protein FliL
MAKNLNNETDPGETSEVEGQTEAGPTPDVSEDVKSGVAAGVSSVPEGEGVTESSGRADTEGGEEDVVPSEAEDPEPGFDDLPEDITIEANQSGKIWSLWKPKKVIAGLVLGFCVSPLVAYGLKHWQMNQEERRQEAPSTWIYRAPTMRNWRAILDLAAFVVLLPEKGDRAYFSLSISVKLSNSGVCREIEGKKTFFRGVIYRVLNEAAKDSSPQAIAKEQLKRDIVSALNGLLISGTIDDIYFTDFLVV